MKNIIVYLLFLWLFSDAVYAQTNGDTIFHFPKEDYAKLEFNWLSNLDIEYEMESLEFKISGGDTIVNRVLKDTFNLKITTLASDTVFLEFHAPNAFLTKIFYSEECVPEEWFNAKVPIVKGVYNFKNHKFSLDNCEVIKPFAQSQFERSKACLDELDGNDQFSSFFESKFESCDFLSSVMVRDLKRVLFLSGEQIIPTKDSISFTEINVIGKDTIHSTYQTYVVEEDQKTTRYRSQEVTEYDQIVKDLMTNEELGPLEREMLLGMIESMPENYLEFEVNALNQMTGYEVFWIFGSPGGQSLASSFVRISRIEP